MHVSVLITEANPEEHPSRHKEWIHLAVDSIYTYNASVRQRGRFQALKQEGEFADRHVRIRIRTAAVL